MIFSLTVAIVVEVVICEVLGALSFQTLNGHNNDIAFLAFANIFELC